MQDYYSIGLSTALRPMQSDALSRTRRNMKQLNMGLFLTCLVSTTQTYNRFISNRLRTYKIPINLFFEHCMRSRDENNTESINYSSDFFTTTSTIILRRKYPSKSNIFCIYVQYIVCLFIFKCHLLHWNSNAKLSDLTINEQSFTHTHTHTHTHTPLFL